MSVADAAEKIVSMDDALARVRKAREQGLRISFTNGCFDLLHAGHELSLSQARKAGEFLVVGVNSDASVKAIKGPGRPIVSEVERARALATLDCVDCVVVFDDADPMLLIQALEPNVLVKGGDYDPSRVVGADFVLSRHGEVRITSHLPGVSTTALIQGMKGKS
jgi:rfaE bifunctional protein nucleotidyltransferase chain/domain